MKPFKPNWSFLCLSMAWFYINICLWNYKLLFGQTTIGRIHAFCRKTDYVANTRFLGLVLTQIFRILLRFYSDICTKNWRLGTLLGCSYLEQVRIQNLYFPSLTSHDIPLTSMISYDFFIFGPSFFLFFPENFTPRDAHCFWQWPPTDLQQPHGDHL